MLELDRHEQTWLERPFSPKYFSLNYIPIRYEKLAKCPKFLTGLLRPAMSDGDISILQKYMGQTILGYNISQTILLLTGTAGGGKSTLVNVIPKFVKKKAKRRGGKQKNLLICSIL